MRQLLAAWVGLLLFVGIASAEVLAPQAFTERFAQAIQQRVAPGMTISVAGELKLEGWRQDGSSVVIHLDNAYRDYARTPANLDQLATVLAASITRPPGTPAKPAKLDRSRIVPVIKTRAWVATQHRLLGDQRHPIELVFDDLIDDIVVVYAEDTKDKTRYLHSTEDIGPRDGLRALAIDNLIRLLPPIKLSTMQGLSVLSAGGDYDASLLLVDHIWSGDQIKVEGDIVVAVPARDVLIVTGSRDRKGLKAMRAAAADLIKGAHPLTERLFVYRGRRFVKFGRD